MENIYNTIELIGFITVLIAWFISILTGKRMNKKLLDQLLNKNSNITEIEKLSQKINEFKETFRREIEQIKDKLERLEITVNLDYYANQFRIKAYKELDRLIDEFTLTNPYLKELYIRGKIQGVDYFLNLLKLDFQNFNKERAKEEMLTLFSGLSDSLEFNAVKRKISKDKLENFIKKEKNIVIIPEINRYLDKLSFIITHKKNGEFLKAFCENSINFMKNIIIKTDKIWNEIINP